MKYRHLKSKYFQVLKKEFPNKKLKIFLQQIHTKYKFLHDHKYKQVHAN
jgi:hypothetical protein